MVVTAAEAKSFSINSAAFGGAGWSPRKAPHRDELGTVWAACGVSTEWARLKSILVHRPGLELAEIDDPNSVQMLDRPDVVRVGAQHDAMVEAYRAAGAAVHYVEPQGKPRPNQMYVADLMFMTPEGAIIARPASTVRAGEERQVARRLADLGVPILACLRGTGTFEGADGVWLDPKTVLLGMGLRTNAEGAAQVTRVLNALGVEVIVVTLPYGSMHLMGTIRIVDRDLALVWPGRVAYVAVEALRARGYQVLAIPDEREIRSGFVFNFVTLGPREILIPSGNPITQRFYEDAGVTCRVVQVDEIIKAAGGIGCLTGLLERASVD